MNIQWPKTGFDTGSTFRKIRIIDAAILLASTVSTSVAHNATNIEDDNKDIKTSNGGLGAGLSIGIMFLPIIAYYVYLRFNPTDDFDTGSDNTEPCSDLESEISDSNNHVNEN